MLSFDKIDIKVCYEFLAFEYIFQEYQIITVQISTIVLVIKNFSHQKFSVVENLTRHMYSLAEDLLLDHKS